MIFPPPSNIFTKTIPEYFICSAANLNTCLSLPDALSHFTWPFFASMRRSLKVYIWHFMKFCKNGTCRLPGAWRHGTSQGTDRRLQMQERIAGGRGSLFSLWWLSRLVAGTRLLRKFRGYPCPPLARKRVRQLGTSRGVRGLWFNGAMLQSYESQCLSCPAPTLMVPSRVCKYFQFFCECTNFLLSSIILEVCFHPPPQKKKP